MRIDYEGNTLKLGNVIIANGLGTMMIRAQEATAHGVELSFNDSVWEFRGDVHIEVEDAILDATTATVTFTANRLGSALVVGEPAQFSHQLKGTTQRNQGHAATIEFDARKAQVLMAGGAWYSDGRNEVNTPTLVYSLADRSLEHTVAEGERVRMTIRPGTGKPETPAPGAPTAK
jgi:lipopolysaccharide transport protein LptA